MIEAVDEDVGGAAETAIRLPATQRVMDRLDPEGGATSAPGHQELLRPEPPWLRRPAGRKRLRTGPACRRRRRSQGSHGEVPLASCGYRLARGCDLKPSLRQWLKNYEDRDLQASPNLVRIELRSFEFYRHAERLNDPAIMSASETPVVLGDEHVGPITSVRSLDAAPTATRAAPQPCEMPGDALACALTHRRRAGGRVPSPAYLRACLRGSARTPNG